jgi:hypothetical protein
MSTLHEDDDDDDAKSDAPATPERHAGVTCVAAKASHNDDSEFEASQVGRPDFFPFFGLLTKKLLFYFKSFYCTKICVATKWQWRA